MTLEGVKLRGDRFPARPGNEVEGRVAPFNVVPARHHHFGAELQKPALV